MPPNLAGLNVVHPPSSSGGGDFDSQDLLSGPSFPDLDIWTHLPFEDVTANTAPGANGIKGGADAADKADTDASPKPVSFAEHDRKHASVCACPIFA